MCLPCSWELLWMWLCWLLAATLPLLRVGRLDQNLNVSALGRFKVVIRGLAPSHSLTTGQAETITIVLVAYNGGSPEIIRVIHLTINFLLWTYGHLFQFTLLSPVHYHHSVVGKDWLSTNYHNQYTPNPTRCSLRLWRVLRYSSMSESLSPFFFTGFSSHTRLCSNVSSDRQLEKMHLVVLCFPA